MGRGGRWALLGKKGREEGGGVGWTLWTMDIGKTCLDQATFEVGAHNVRGGSQAKTHKKYNIPRWGKTKKERYCSHKKQLQILTKVSSTDVLHFRQKEGSSSF